MNDDKTNSRATDVDYEAELRQRAKTLATRALNRRVSSGEWKVANEVAVAYLRDLDLQKMVPMKEALTVVLDTIRLAGFEVVQTAAKDALLTACDAFGLHRDFPTDQPKLRAVKTALRAFRFSTRQFW